MRDSARRYGLACLLLHLTQTQPSATIDSRLRVCHTPSPHPAQSGLNLPACVAPGTQLIPSRSGESTRTPSPPAILIRVSIRGTRSPRSKSPISVR